MGGALLGTVQTQQGSIASTCGPRSYRVVRTSVTAAAAAAAGVMGGALAWYCIAAAGSAASSSAQAAAFALETGVTAAAPPPAAARVIGGAWVWHGTAAAVGLCQTCGVRSHGCNSHWCISSCSNRENGDGHWLSTIQLYQGRPGWEHPIPGLTGAVVETVRQ